MHRIATLFQLENCMKYLSRILSPFNSSALHCRKKHYYIKLKRLCNILCPVAVGKMREHLVDQLHEGSTTCQILRTRRSQLDLPPTYLKQGSRINIFTLTCLLYKIYLSFQLLICCQGYDFKWNLGAGKTASCCTRK